MLLRIIMGQKTLIFEEYSISYSIPSLSLSLSLSLYLSLHSLPLSLSPLTSSPSAAHLLVCFSLQRSLRASSVHKQLDAGKGVHNFLDAELIILDSPFSFSSSSLFLAIWQCKMSTAEELFNACCL